MMLRFHLFIMSTQRRHSHLIYTDFLSRQWGTPYQAFPTFISSIGSYETCQPFAYSLWSPRPAAASSTRCFFAPFAGASDQGPVLSFQVKYARFMQEETGRLFPSSWRIPVTTCPRLLTPAAPDGLALSVVQILPSALTIASASATMNDFRAEPSRITFLLSTLLHLRSPDKRQDSLTVCPIDLDRAGLTPDGFL
jgi:hypothetical protein